MHRPVDLYRHDLMQEYMQSHEKFEFFTTEGWRRVFEMRPETQF